jgi:hypothetical protein
MEKSLEVKVQYFHDALISHLEMVEATLISSQNISSQEFLRLEGERKSLGLMIKRFEEVFNSVIYKE